MPRSYPLIHVCFSHTCRVHYYSLQNPVLRQLSDVPRMASCVMSALQVLLGAKAAVCAFDDNNQTALHHAAAGGHHEIVSLLISSVANCAASQRALRQVCAQGSLEEAPQVVRAFLAQADTKGQTALHHAAAACSAASIRLLTEAGASASARNHDGLLPEDLAERQAESNPSPEMQHRSQICAQFLRDMRVGVVMAAGSGDVHRLEEFISQGASVDGFDDQGRTALCRAVAGGFKEVGCKGTRISSPCLFLLSFMHFV